MKSFAVVLSFAISAVALSSAFMPASATRMNGKCCMSSDGGRSHRYWVAMHRTAIPKIAIPKTCSGYAAACTRSSSARPDRVQMCMAAKNQCLLTGVHVGPYSGWQYAGLQKK
jgi:hypothetical protein